MMSEPGDMNDVVALYVAWGRRYIEEAERSRRSLLDHHKVHTILVTDQVSDSSEFDEIVRMNFELVGNLRKLEGMRLALERKCGRILFLDTDVTVLRGIDFVWLRPGYVLHAAYAPHYDLEYFKPVMSRIFSDLDLPSAGFPTLNSGVVFFEDVEESLRVLDFAVDLAMKYAPIISSDQALLSTAVHKIGACYGVLPMSFNFRGTQCELSGVQRIWHHHDEVPQGLNSDVAEYPRYLRKGRIVVNKKIILPRFWARVDLKIQQLGRLGFVRWAFWRYVGGVQVDCRIFVVGCGHSGTSILASVIGSHKDVHLIEYESNVYTRGDKCTAGFDSRAVSFGQKVWIEKTPGHVHHIGEILMREAGSRVVFIHRNPWDCIGSMVKRGFSFDDSLSRYIEDNSAAWSAVDEGLDVLVLSYERFVRELELIKSVVSEYCGLDGDAFTSHQGGAISYSNGSYVGKKVGEMNHEELRDWQVRQPVFDNIGESRKALSSAEMLVVSERTVELCRRMGYSLS